MLREYKAIIKNYFANVYGMGVTILNQIVMVPIFINFWGVEKYGNWIIITAFSSFFSMANLGLNQATNNEFVISYQFNDLRKCNSLLVNSFYFILSITLIILMLGAGFASFYGFKETLSVTLFNSLETNTIFMLLLFNVFIKMLGGIYNGVFRIKHKAHLNAIIENTIKLVETFILVLGLVYSLKLSTILLLYNIPVLTSIVIKHFYSLRHFRVSFSVKFFDFKLLKQIIYPSVGFMLIPLSQAISNQGMIFVVNSVLGPMILVLFTTTRTLVNFIRTIVDLFGNSIYPEISIAWGQQKINTILKIFNGTLKIVLASIFLIVAVLWFFGEDIFLRWTKNSVEFNDYFFKGMLIVIIVTTLSKLYGILLLSTNNHNNYTNVFLLCQLFNVSMTYFVLKFFSLDLSFVTIIIFFSETILLIYTYYNVKKIFYYK